MDIFSAAAHTQVMKIIDPSALLSPEMSTTRVGSRIAAMREALKMSKAQFADSAGIDRSALSRIEAGRDGLGIQKALIISEIYGFGLNYIYRGDLSDTPISLRVELLNELHRLQALPAQTPRTTN